MSNDWIGRTSVMAVRTRPMTSDDMAAAKELLSQLGYPLNDPELYRRYEDVSRAASHALIVAEDGGGVVALCHVYGRPSLDKPSEAVVQALVVSDKFRGAGIGRLMMVAAENWARNHGFSSVALYSSVARDEAHAFYESIGYVRAATSHMFRKDLNSGGT